MTDAEYSNKITLDTHYLVATRFDTVKARKAAENGTAVISQEEMAAFINAGEFPEVIDFMGAEAGLHWESLPDEEQVAALLDYVDADGVVIEQRLVKLHSRYAASNGIEYLGAMHGRNFRTYRVDRILNLKKFE